MADCTPALIRDARGITSLEAVFLYTVDSRGEQGMFTSAEKAAADMKMALRTFRTVRKSLVAKSLITVQERPPRTSIYKVAPAALASLTSAPATSAGDARVTSAAGAWVPVREVHGSPVQEVHSQEEQRKRNGKTTTNSLPTTSLPSFSFLPSRFQRGMPPKQEERKSEPAPVATTEQPYPYNKYRQDCFICGRIVEVEEGMLLRDRTTGKRVPAHHWGDCKGITFTQEQDVEYCSYLVPTNLPARQDKSA